MPDYDVIVIGSGFGGAITACRLAEAGCNVLILERGRRWSHEASHADFFPRDPLDKRRWLWCEDNPVHYHGWLDLRVFPNMSVAQGAAVGGGSQIYANVSVEAPSQAFEDHPGVAPWPRAIRKPELQPYYDAVAREMRVRPIPQSQWSSRTRLVQEAAHAIHEGGRFRTIPLAVNFDDALTVDPASPDRPQRDPASIRPNVYGVPQGACYHCGHCDLGCDVNARNTLDTNYIPRAEQTKLARVLPLHIVRNIEPLGGGYRVHFERIDKTRLVPGSASARLVVVAAGSLGSTELLLRCRDVTGSLPHVSQRLGHGWTSNGDFLTPALYADRTPPPYPSEGPPITAVIDFLDRSQHGESFWIQDGGFPNLLLQWLAGAGAGRRHPRNWLLLESLRTALAQSDPGTRPAALPPRFGQLSHIMPWFAQAVDAGDGRLTLKRRWSVFGARRLMLHWNVARSETAINAVVAMHKRLCAATGGIPLIPPAWSVFKDLVTPHPLGGCAMADSPGQGVVNHAGEVFGHRNLFVADGAVFPRAIGVNPSRTIGALAERIAAGIISRTP